MTQNIYEKAEEERLKAVRHYQHNKLLKAKNLGRRARDRKQSIRVNPFSADSQRMLHAVWDDGFVRRDAELLGEEVGVKPLELPPLPQRADEN